MCEGTTQPAPEPRPVLHSGSRNDLSGSGGQELTPNATPAEPIGDEPPTEPREHWAVTGVREVAGALADELRRPRPERSR